MGFGDAAPGHSPQFYLNLFCSCDAPLISSEHGVHKPSARADLTESSNQLRKYGLTRRLWVMGLGFGTFSLVLVVRARI